MSHNRNRLLLFACLVALLLVSFSGSAANADPPPDDGIEPAVIAEQSPHRVSGSPYLRLPAEVRNIPMMEAPTPSAEPAPADPVAVEIYEVASGQTTIVASDDPSQAPVVVDSSSVGSNPGLLPTAPTTDTPIGADDRVRVTATANFPWRTVTKLYMTFPDGSQGGCSGAIIDNFHILTAGHCVHEGSGGDWASSIRVVPGLDDDYMPYNEAWATSMRSYTGWTQSSMTEHDWAVVTLDRNIGAWLGWMGRITADSGNSFYTGILNNAGYPGSTPSDDPCPSYGNCMYFDSDNGHSADEYNHWYWIDTAGGQSGSPVWRYLSDTGERHVATVHTCGTGGCGIDGKGVNHGTRLNQDKYDRIFTWLGEDSPPTDYADLIDDGEIYAGFSPINVTAGVTLFDVWNDVRNVGTAESGTFSVSYYASTNSTISTSDHLIGTSSISSVSPFTWSDSSWSGTFPASIPDGTYYVGWIIDANNDVTEYAENNNTAYVSTTQLVVGSLTAPPPNDDIDNATQVNSNPFTDLVDTTGATTAGDDPILPCGSGDTGSETVWYEVNIAQETEVYANTFGSNYDTMLALWSGTRGSLSNVACNDDTGSLQSEIGARVPAGTYYLEVADYLANGAVSAESKTGTGAENDPAVVHGGDLQLFVELTPVLYPDINVSPSSFEVTLAPNVVHMENLTIGNVGDASLSVTLGVMDTTASSASWSPLTFPDEPVEPEVYEQIRAAPNGIGTFLVYLTEQADLSSALAIADHKSRGQAVYNSLWQTARNSQGSLKKFLDLAVSERRVTEYRPYYIVNAIAVSGTEGIVNALAARSDVAYIEAFGSYSIPEPSPGSDSGVATLEWGVGRIGADAVWSNSGTRGEGIVVANIDSGVLHTHSALVSQYRGTLTGSHDYNWFDPTGLYPVTPGDNNGHGTHTMGTMVGDDGGSNQIGVAPGATWIAAKGCEDNSCSGTALLASAEWILAPFPIGGSPANADPSKRPHVVNNSWGGSGGDLWYQAVVNNWRAAGIFPAFSAGNSGPASGTIGSPGDYAESFSSGATDINDSIASFSSRGPSSLTGESKPDVSAPGVNVRSAYNDGGYASLNGTSMASPHTAGCAALIFAAAPGVSITQAENAMTTSAVDLGSAGPDFDYGHGRLDCEQAVSLAGPGVDWLSTNPNSASISPGSDTVIDIEFDTTGLSVGDYSADIVIVSNDPDESPLIVPVMLHVRDSTESPILSMDDSIPATSGQQVAVPVHFDNRGASIVTLTFSVDFDINEDDLCLLYDSTSFSLPENFTGNASLTGSRVDISILTFDFSNPLPTSDLGQILFHVSSDPACQPTPPSTIVEPLNFMNASAGDIGGNAVSVSTDDGSIEINGSQRGDCNGDGKVDAGDISACILEIFDGDGDLAGDAPGGSYPGDPIGCDSNADGLINAGDIACKILIIFNGPGACNGPAARLSAAAETAASLTIPSQVAVDPGQLVTIPVMLETGGNDVAAATFSLGLDTEWLPVDSTDSNGDGVADLVTFLLPDEFTASATVNVTDNTVDIFIADLSVPLSALPNGELLTLTVTAGVPPDGRSRIARAGFSDSPIPSLGSTSGQSINTEAVDGSVLITPVVAVDQEYQLYLPVITK